MDNMAEQHGVGSKAEVDNELNPPSNKRSFMTTLLFIIFFLAVSHSLYVHASYLKRSSVGLDKILALDATIDLVAPDGYGLLWSVNGQRGSIGPKAGIIDYSAMAGKTNIVQTTLQKCVDQCASSSSCTFVQVMLLQGAKVGSVVCATYSHSMVQSAVTYSMGPNNDGTVIKTYGLSKLGTTAGILPTAVSPSSGAGPVVIPTGGKLIDFQPCPGIKATIPMIVNDQYTSSDAKDVYVIQHGAGSNPGEYFGFLYPMLGTKSILVAPAMYSTHADPTPASFYQPDKHLAWQSGLASWTAGNDAVAPTTGDNAIQGGTCSSFDVYDALLDYFDDKSKFANLQNIYFVGHSGGANAVERYSMFYTGKHPFKTRFIVANAANHAYATDARPEVTVCDSAKKFPYQLDRLSMNRYVTSKFYSRLYKWDLTYKLWSMQDVTFLVGDMDTLQHFPVGSQNCQNQAQGGSNRRDRNYAFWAYQNILFGTKENVSKYYGYDQLIKTGAKIIVSSPRSPFNHQNCVVSNVGHDPEAMFKSDCAKSAFFNIKTIPGAGPSGPEGLGQ